MLDRRLAARAFMLVAPWPIYTPPGGYLDDEEGSVVDGMTVKHIMSDVNDMAARGPRGEPVRVG